jgi:hypothetical protein
MMRNLEPLVDREEALLLQSTSYLVLFEKNRRIDTKIASLEVLPFPPEFYSTAQRLKNEDASADLVVPEPQPLSTAGRPSSQALALY